jgi:1-acyl-sn-glycerol-3-phosphate acyltransferase
MKSIQCILFLAYSLCRVFFLRHLHNTKPLQENYIIISNHIHSLDPFLIVAQFRFQEFRSITPLFTITANKYVIGKWYSPLLRSIGCFPVKENHLGIPYGLEASIKYAKQGSLLIFPEGARSTVHSIERLHSGAAVIAQETNRPVLPIFIKQNPGRLIRRFSLVRGAPFDARDMNIDQMMEKVWELDKELK